MINCWPGTPWAQAHYTRNDTLNTVTSRHVRSVRWTPVAPRTRSAQSSERPDRCAADNLGSGRSQIYTLLIRRISRGAARMQHAAPITNLPAPTNCEFLIRILYQGIPALHTAFSFNAFLHIYTFTIIRSFYLGLALSEIFPQRTINSVSSIYHNLH